MEKHLEENPFNPQREEDIFVTKNDISKKKKSVQGFKTLEEIPDTDPFNKYPEEELEEEKTTDEEFADYVDEINYEKKSDEEKIRQLAQEIKFSQGEGVASVGPDVEGNLVGEGDKEEEFKSIEIDPASSSSTIEPMNPLRSHTIKSDYELRSYKREKATGKDNLKTIPESKKERSFRQKIKDFFTTQVHEETPQHKREEQFDDRFFAESLDEATLNGKRMDKRFLDDENKAA
jgi:hypothetical protein